MTVALQFSRLGAIVFRNKFIKGYAHSLCQVMGRIRLKVRELVDEKGWTLKEVSDRTGIPYATVKKYAQAASLATVDYTALQKLARLFDVSIEDLVDVLEE